VLPLFSLEVIILSPLRFGVTPFFIGGLCFEPIVFWGSLFSLEVFVLSPLHFGVGSFFSRGHCFEPMSKGCDNMPSIVSLA
jgi:hypothetical protein